MNDLTSRSERMEQINHELRELRDSRRNILLFFLAMAIFFIGLALIGK